MNEEPKKKNQFEGSVEDRQIRDIGKNLSMILHRVFTTGDSLEDNTAELGHQMPEGGSGEYVTQLSNMLLAFEEVRTVGDVRNAITNLLAITSFLKVPNHKLEIAKENESNRTILLDSLPLLERLLAVAQENKIFLPPLHEALATASNYFRDVNEFQAGSKLISDQERTDALRFREGILSLEQSLGSVAEKMGVHY